MLHLHERISYETSLTNDYYIRFCLCNLAIGCFTFIYLCLSGNLASVCSNSCFKHPQHFLFFSGHIIHLQHGRTRISAKSYVIEPGSSFTFNHIRSCSWRHVLRPLSNHNLHDHQHHRIYVFMDKSLKKEKHQRKNRCWQQNMLH